MIYDDNNTENQGKLWPLQYLEKGIENKYGKSKWKVVPYYNSISPNQFQVYYTAKSTRPYLKENVGKHLHDVSIAKTFLIQKALTIKSVIDKSDCIKIKDVCSPK